MTPHDHIAGSMRNLEFADGLKRLGGDGASVGWAITGIFYAALHAVRALYLAADGNAIDSHEACKALMRNDRRVEPFRTAYNELKQQSERARYYLDLKFTWSDYDFLRQKAVKVIKACCRLAKLPEPDTAPKNDTPPPV